MADFAKHLPLSMRQSVDESGANSRWGGHIAATLRASADVLESLTPEQWETQSLCGLWRVRDVAGHLVWRTGSSNRVLVDTFSRAYVGHFVNPNRAIDVLSRAAAEASTTDLVARLREIADEKAAGHGRTGVSELSEAVVHGYDLARPLGFALSVAPSASGAVALRGSLLAPTEIKAVLRTRTVVATDAAWQVGRGRPLLGTADTLVPFIYGRGGLPEPAIEPNR